LNLVTWSHLYLLRPFELIRATLKKWNIINEKFI